MMGGSNQAPYVGIAELPVHHHWKDIDNNPMLFIQSIKAFPKVIVYMDGQDNVGSPMYWIWQRDLADSMTFDVFQARIEFRDNPSLIDKIIDLFGP